MVYVSDGLKVLTIEQMLDEMAEASVDVWIAGDEDNTLRVVLAASKRTALFEEARRRDAVTPLPRADLEAVLAFVLRLGTQFPGKEYPPHVLAAIRLRRWLEGEAHA
jgi:hypothetical protein